VGTSAGYGLRSGLTKTAGIRGVRRPFTAEEAGMRLAFVRRETACGTPERSL